MSAYDCNCPPGGNRTWTGSFEATGWTLKCSACGSEATARSARVGSFSIVPPDSRATTIARLTAELVEARERERVLREAMDLMEDAAIAQQTMRDQKEPQKLDEALSWRENDEKADAMLHRAQTAARALAPKP